MIIIQSDFKKGTVKLLPQDQDDLWYASELIEVGDVVTSLASRKIKIGDGENAKSVKKTFVCSISVETVEYTGAETRVNGKVVSGIEDAPTGSYQAIAIEEKQDFTLHKDMWSVVMKKRLEESTSKKEQLLVMLFDREEALFATSSSSGFKVLFQCSGEVSKKDRDIAVKKEFYDELIELLIGYVDRLKPELVILGSAGFFKQEIAKKIPASLRSKVVYATVSSVSSSAFSELLTDAELGVKLKDSRTAQDSALIDELLRAISKNEPCEYGFAAVLKAVQAGAVKIVLVSDGFISSRKLSGVYGEVSDLLSLVESLGATIHILKSATDPGKKLDGLGGIACLLRYAI